MTVSTQAKRQKQQQSVQMDSDSSVLADFVLSSDPLFGLPSPNGSQYTTSSPGDSASGSIEEQLGLSGGEFDWDQINVLGSSIDELVERVDGNNSSSNNSNTGNTLSVSKSMTRNAVREGSVSSVGTSASGCKQEIPSNNSSMSDLTTTAPSDFVLPNFVGAQPTVTTAQAQSTAMNAAILAQAYASNPALAAVAAANVAAAAATWQQQFGASMGGVAGVPNSTTPAATVAAPAPAPAVVGDKIQISRLPGGNSKSVHIVTKAEKKLAHNAIERRYRNSINDRITQLKTTLPFSKDSEGPSGKMNKANVLRKAIEYIEFLQGANERLKAENEAFKQAMEKAGIDHSKIPVNVPEGRRADRSPSTDKSTCSTDEEEAMSPSSNGANSGVRLSMFMFMGVLFFFNPMSLMFSSSSLTYGTEGSSSRVLLGLHESTEDGSFFWTFVVFAWEALWMVTKVLVSIFCFGHIISYEPVVSDYEKAKNFRKVALAKANEKDYAGAVREITSGLECLGRYLPASSIDLAWSMTWQLTRAILHKLYIGVWVDRFIVNRTESSRLSCALSAELFQDLNNMYMNCEHETKSFAYNANALLCSMNLAECVSADVNGKILTEIYLSSALFAKMSMPSMPFTTRYCLADARHSRVPNKDDKRWSWMFTPSGHSYIMELQADVEEQLDSVDTFACPQFYNPLSKLGRMYRLSLLSDAFLQFHVSAKSTSCIYTVFEEILHLSEEATDNCCSWWSYMGMAVACSRSGEFSKGVRLMKNAEHAWTYGEKSPSQEAFALALTSMFAFKTQNYELSLKVSKGASSMLKDIVHNKSPVSSFESNVLITAASILLSSRLEFWNELNELQSVSSDKKELNIKNSSLMEALSLACNVDLNSFRLLERDSSGLTFTYIQLYQAILRCVAGGNSSRTHLLFEKAVADASLNNMEYAKAYGLLKQTQFFDKQLSLEEKHHNLTCANELFEAQQCHEVLACKTALKNAI
eukprot:Nk52_evm81s151 gene=Nk52_evmTU81s151